MLIDEKFEMGKIVYLHTDPDQLPRMVTGYVVRPYGLLEYKLTSGTEETNHFDLEISETVSVIMRSTF